MGSYKNARDILPDHLLRAVQGYLEGDTLYIPVKGERRRWGERTGARLETEQRNQKLRDHYRKGASAEELAAQYHLSIETVRKLIRGSGRERL